MGDTSPAATNLHDALAALRQPFTPAAVKFKPLTNPHEGRSSAAFYIDARLVAERLNTVVGPDNWSDDYNLIAEGRETPALYYPVVCRLTVFGVTKTDVGQGANTVVDEKAWKSAYSDALKRAAVKFGIGAYLYAIPRLYAPVDVGPNGKAKGFSREGRQYLLEKYRGWLASDLNTFGDPLDHGDIADDDDDTPATVAAASSNGSGNGRIVADQEHVDALMTLAESLVEAKRVTVQQVASVAGGNLDETASVEQLRPILANLDANAAGALLARLDRYAKNMQVAG